MAEDSTLNGTFEVTHNGTFEVTPSKTMTRERQKTMVVESNIVKEVRELFTRARLNGEEFDIAQLEASALASVQRFEADSTRKIKEAEGKHDMDLLWANGLLEEFSQTIETLFAGIESGRYGSGGGAACGESCAKMKLDLDAAHTQLEDRFNEFMRLVDSHEKLRKATLMQKEEYGQLEEVARKEHAKNVELKLKFQRLKDSATAQLAQASDDVTRMEHEHEEKTLGMRLRVKQLEQALALKDQEMEIKQRELEQLKDMVQTLMKELQPMSDEESEK